jgi:hypothetical protein
VKVSDAFRKAFRGEEVAVSGKEEVATDEVATEEVSKGVDTLNKVLLITQEGCQGCDLAEEYLKEEIADGSITVCPLGADECSKIANELHLNSTPSIVSVDGKGIHHKCEIRTEGDDFLFECPVDPSSSSSSKEGEVVAEERAPPPKHGKVGKLGITCISQDVKNKLGWFLQSEPELSPDILPLVGSLPECGSREDGMPIPLGFSEVKKSGGTKTKAGSARGNFMRECLSGKTGEAQPLRMSRCSREWREKSDNEKKKYS